MIETRGPRSGRALLRFPRPVAAALVLSVVAGGPAIGQTAPARAFVPYSEPPINYLTEPVNDPVARLQERIDRGEAALEFEPRRGYLDSVLGLLEIPASSQTLVFSKTSLQYRKISPTSPRALYFNDNVYVGWVRGGDLLEIASFDPKQGAIFYLLDQRRTESPALLRASIDCTQCHVAPGTRNVPGVFLRSIVPTSTGSQVPRSPSTVTGHESPLEGRFGGWYVTGTTGGQAHRGNAFAPDREHPERLDRGPGDVVDLAGRFPTGDYASSHSDVVAQMVLAHQTQMHNLITLVNYRTRMALHDAKARGEEITAAARKEFEGPAEELVRYLLFVDEAPLEGPVTGTSGFEKDFVAPGPRDPRGRSLRDFDLRRRIFRYPCSYLIYSEAYDAIPAPARDYVERRLLEILTGRDRSAAFARLSSDDRRDVLEILRATKPNLPEGWKAAPTEGEPGGPPR